MYKILYILIILHTATNIIFREVLKKVSIDDITAA
jgi:hypothetical protein